ncbi:MAG: alpha/beta fold hydrolase, partial [Methylocella sp.]
MSFSKSELITPSGIRTHYLEAGSGAPVLLLHGSGPGVSAEANWAQTIPTLAKNFHVYAPDMAGFGESGWPSEDVGIKLWVRQLIEFIDALDLKPVCAVGNSFGGGLALAATLRFPDHFRRLVLMGTPAGSFPQT